MPVVRNIGQILNVRRQRWGGVRADKPLGGVLRLCQYLSCSRIELSGVDIARADHKAVVEGTRPRKSDRDYLPYVRLYQLGRTLGFPICHANHPGAHAPRPVGSEEDVFAVRRPAK